MFDVILDEDLRALATVESPHCVSFYLPTHTAGSGVAEDPVRLKNLIAGAKKELQKLGMRTSATADLLGPVKAVVDDPHFWAYSAAGLAIFASPQGVQRFRLPGPVEEAAIVSDRLWIAPLLPFIGAGGDFHVLALSHNQVRLLRGNRYQVVELDLGDIPVSMAEALRFDDREAGLHSHGADRVGSGRVSATFHGHGGAGAFDDVDQARFLQAVDRGLAGIVTDRSTPLVLAGVEEIVSRFRKLSSYPTVADSFIAGNPEQLSPQELHDRSLPLVAPYLEADRRRASELFGSPSTPTVETVPDVLDAAASGRVATLFIRSGQPIWGTHDAESRLVDEHADRQPGDRELTDLMARETLGHGGTVFAVDASDMPIDGPAAAVLRY